MKKSDIFETVLLGMLGATGFLIIIGAAGSYEVDAMNLPQVFLAVCVGVAIFGLAVLIARRK